MRLSKVVLIQLIFLVQVVTLQTLKTRARIMEQHYCFQL